MDLSVPSDKPDAVVSFERLMKEIMPSFKLQVKKLPISKSRRHLTNTDTASIQSCLDNALGFNKDIFIRVSTSSLSYLQNNQEFSLPVFMNYLAYEFKAEFLTGTLITSSSSISQTEDFIKSMFLIHQLCSCKALTGQCLLSSSQENQSSKVYRQQLGIYGEPQERTQD